MLAALFEVRSHLSGVRDFAAPPSVVDVLKRRAIVLAALRLLLIESLELLDFPNRVRLQAHVAILRHHHLLLLGDRHLHGLVLFLEFDHRIANARLSQRALRLGLVSGVVLPQNLQLLRLIFCILLVVEPLSEVHGILHIPHWDPGLFSWLFVKTLLDRPMA